MSEKKLKIALGMSGGVDSSVSAYLLKKEGYEVHGFFMKLWADPSSSCEQKNIGYQEKVMSDARKVAQKLGIPFQVVSARTIFKKNVVDYFVSEYKNLVTPNPCVQCNKLVKFGWFLDFAKKKGFDKVATGHYARIVREKNAWKLLSGCDQKKDQSYFLYKLDQERLQKITFPLGELTKEEARKIARRIKLPVSEKKESQEICFLSGEDYRAYLRRHLKKNYFKEGDIVDQSGQKIGHHTGLINYTIGQRKGIIQTAKNENRESLFVQAFDKKKNELVASSEQRLYAERMILKNISWISLESEKKAFKNKKLKVKIRYRHSGADCVIKRANNSQLEVIFSSPQRAVTPGQSAVFYLGEEVLGGGTIIS